MIAVNYYCIDALMFQICLPWLWVLVMMLSFPVSTTTNGTVIVIAIVVDNCYCVIFLLFYCQRPY